MRRRGVLAVCLVVLVGVAAAPLWASNRLYSFPLDSDPGWARDASWDYGPASSSCCVDEAWTGTNILGSTLGTSYPAPMAMEYLVTDALDCSALSEVYLRFWRWLEIADSTLATVEVSNNGSSWTTIWQTDGVNFWWDDEWVEFAYDITALAAGQATVYVRWGLEVYSTCSCAGWAVDDVEIWDGVPEPPPIPQTIYYFPLDYDPGWTTEGDWAFGIPAGLGGDPSSGYTGDYVYGYNLNGAYPDNMPAYSLTTTPLNCTGFKDVTVSFQRWLGVERDWWDQALFQVSNDGSSWTTVWENDSTDLQDVSWVPVEYDISAVADGQPTVYLRWVMGPSDFMVTYSGWNIDDVLIAGLRATEVLTWVPYTDAGEYWNTLSGLDSVYGDYNLTTSTTTDPGVLAGELVGKHVFLVMEQEFASEAEMAALGSAFADTLWGFAESGGTIVVLMESSFWDGPPSYEGFLNATGLMSVDYLQYNNYGSLTVLDPSHPLMEGVSNPFDGENAFGTYVIGPEAISLVEDASGDTVVASRQVGAGAVVLVGFDFFAYNTNIAAILANAVRYPRFSREVLLYESSPHFRYGLEALNRLNQPGTLADDWNFNSTLVSQDWNMVVGDVPNLAPQEEGYWQPFIDWIGAGGYALLSTWNLAGQTSLAAAFGVGAGPNLDGVPPAYEWDVGPPLFDFREQVPTAVTAWQDVYWGVDANRLTSTAPDTIEIAGFTVAPTTGEAAVVMGNGARTLIDGFLWDDAYQDADDDGLQDVTELVMNQILMILCVPLPDFSASVTSGNAPLTVDFTDETRGAVESWDWDFGDGGASTEQDPSHTYLAGGLYTVTLTTANVNGSDMMRKVDYISVAPPEPTVADFSATPTSGSAPLDVTFTDESTGVLLSTWEWDFGDGGTSTEQNPTHQYTAAGTYTVSLTVTGFAGPDTETKVDYISVGAPPPTVAAFSATPTSGNAPLNVTFTDESTGVLLSSWSWDFGDGGTSTQQNPTHEYTTAGTYTVSLTVTGFAGPDTETKTDYITVGTAAGASFSATPLEGIVPLVVAFTDLSTGDTVGWDWDFGDGASSTAQNPSHEYTAPGRYDVSLTTSDNYASDTETKANYIAVGFPDTPPDTFWAFDEVLDCVDAGVVGGYDDGLYHPDIQIDRAQMATYTARALAGGDSNVPAGPGTPTFPDVDTDFWAYKYIEYAVSEDVVQGYDDGYYHPEIVLDRGQMAVFIARAVAGDDASVPDGPAEPTFPDVATDFWSYKHVEYCVDQGIVGGYDDGLYHPEYPVTRDQMAVYVARALPLL